MALHLWQTADKLSIASYELDPLWFVRHHKVDIATFRM